MSRRHRTSVLSRDVSRTMRLGSQVSSDNDVRGLTERIRSYLAANPNAADDVEGISNWWLGGAVVEPDVLRAALDILVADGLLVLRRLPTGTAVYEHRSTRKR